MTETKFLAFKIKQWFDKNYDALLEEYLIKYGPNHVLNMEEREAQEEQLAVAMDDIEEAIGNVLQK